MLQNKYTKLKKSNIPGTSIISEKLKIRSSTAFVIFETVPHGGFIVLRWLTLNMLTWHWRLPLWCSFLYRYLPLLLQCMPQRAIIPLGLLRQLLWNSHWAGLRRPGGILYLRRAGNMWRRSALATGVPLVRSECEWASWHRELIKTRRAFLYLRWTRWRWCHHVSSLLLAVNTTIDTI